MQVVFYEILRKKNSKQFQSSNLRSLTQNYRSLKVSAKHVIDFALGRNELVALTNDWKSQFEFHFGIGEQCGNDNIDIM